MRRIALAGLMFSGKDYLAERLPDHEKISVSEFGLKFCEDFFGTRDKKIVRDFLQKIFLWGWDCDFQHSEATVERALWTHAIRSRGGDGFEPWWYWYGRETTFWINALRSRHCLDSKQEQNFIFVNHRFRHEVRPLREMGFETFLVACSDGTRRERSDHTLTWKQDNEISERYARRLLDELPDSRIVWNDPYQDPPTNREFLNVESFLELVNNDA